MPYADDLKRVKDYAEWLRPVPWSMFATLTFAGRVSHAQGNVVFRDFIDKSEKYLKCDIGYVRGDEKRPSGCGKSACGLHYHAVLACAARIDISISRSLEVLWQSMAGKRNDDAGAQIELYDPDQKGLEYVLKGLSKPEATWDIGKLELFLPRTPGEKTTAHKRRHQQRHQLRLEHNQA
jgi:hypothetical protein